MRIRQTAGTVVDDCGLERASFSVRNLQSAILNHLCNAASEDRQDLIDVGLCDDQRRAEGDPGVGSKRVSRPLSRARLPSGTLSPADDLDE
jgi:hypothetical protein